MAAKGTTNCAAGKKDCAPSDAVDSIECRLTEITGKDKDDFFEKKTVEWKNTKDVVTWGAVGKFDDATLALAAEELNVKEKIAKIGTEVSGKILANKRSAKVIVVDQVGAGSRLAAEYEQAYNAAWVVSKAKFGAGFTHRGEHVFGIDVDVGGDRPVVTANVAAMLGRPFSFGLTLGYKVPASETVEAAASASTAAKAQAATSLPKVATDATPAEDAVQNLKLRLAYTGVADTLIMFTTDKNLKDAKSEGYKPGFAVVRKLSDKVSIAGTVTYALAQADAKNKADPAKQKDMPSGLVVGAGLAWQICPDTKFNIKLDSDYKCSGQIVQKVTDVAKVHLCVNSPLNDFKPKVGLKLALSF
jgi:hypothetical protein